MAKKSALARFFAQGAATTFVVLVLLASVGPWVWQVQTGDTVDGQMLSLGAQAPSLRHPCGTDFFGRDLFLRTLLGLRMSLTVGLFAALVASAIGTLIGAISGFVGGLLDSLLMRLVDILYTLPFMFLVIVLVTFLGRSLFLLFVALGLVGWLSTARLVRGVVLSLREHDFVVALQAMGATNRRIIFLHLIPNAFGAVIVSFTLSIPAMVLDEAFLSFLGLGVQAPMPSLGSLINEGVSHMLITPWQLCVPGAVLILLLGSLNALGDSIQRWANNMFQGP